MVTVQCIGTGDAFGSGGRMNACYLIKSQSITFLVDCGASSLIALKKLAIDPGSIDAIIISHLHGDHFAGIPFIIRETQIAAKRNQGLTILGPIGTRKRIESTLNMLFPSDAEMPTAFSLEYIELLPFASVNFQTIFLNAFPAIHSYGTNPLSLRIDVDGIIIGYTGDTEWTEHIPRIAENADLLICEMFTIKKRKNHLSLSDLEQHQQQLNSNRLLLVHMSDEVLNNNSIAIEKAFDGMVITLENK
jgi:ribonuclease BN (tRNA processing enzyme)